MSGRHAHAMLLSLALVACPSLDGFSAHAEGGSDALGCGADFQNDAKNCGVCGHDCLGGACSAGVCQPVAVVAGLARASSLAVSDTYIAWMTNGANVASSFVFLCTRQDCGETLKQVDQSILPARGVGLTSSHLFWAYDPSDLSFTNGRAMGCDPSGCKVPAQLKGDPFVAVDVRPGDQDIFFLRSDSGGIIEAYDSSGTRSFWGTPVGTPKQLAVYALGGVETVYYANTSGEIHSATLGGSLGNDVVRGAGPLGIFAADDQRIVWSTGAAPDALQSCARQGCSTNGPTSIVTGLASPITSLASDGARIYMSDAGGRILSCDPTRCGDSMVVLAQGQPSPTAVTKRFGPPTVYWLDLGAGATNGTIMRVAE